MSLLQMMTGCWGIEPSALREIHAIYATHLKGEKINVAAVEARLGHPLAHKQQADYAIEAGGVAVIDASGPMAPKANLFMEVSGGISTQMLARQVTEAADNSSVRSILLAIDSPGGSVVGVPEAAEAVYRAASIKPVVVQTTDMLASAAYYVGAAANALFVSGPLVAVGSIGVLVARTYDPTQTEISDDITAGKYKRLGNSREPLTTESRAIVQADVDYCYSIFVDDVARFRGTTPALVLEHMAEGRVFRGQQAIDAGLVDGVFTRAALMAQMASNPDQFAARRRARFKTSAAGSSQSTSAGAAPEDITATLEGHPMDPKLTRESLQQDHAPLYQQITTEAHAAGAKAERDRIDGVRAQVVPGHEGLIEALAADGKTTPAEAAMAVNAAVRASITAATAAHREDAPSAVKPSAAPADKPSDKKAQLAQAQAYAVEHKTDLPSALKALGFSK